MEKSAFKEQAMGAFWNTYAPHQAGDIEIASNDISALASITWLRIALANAHTDPALHLSLMALCLSNASRMHQSPNLKHSSIQFYDSALREIKAALDNPARTLDDTVLAAVMILRIYETHDGSARSGSSWVAHVTGASQLICMRGAKNDSSEFGRSLYFGHQIDQLICDIGRRKGPCTHMYYNVGPPDPDHKQLRLMLILREIPLFIQETDAVKTQDGLGELIATIGFCHSHAHKLVNELEALEQDLRITHGRDLYWQTASQLYSALPLDSPERIFPTYLSFPSLAIANQLLLIWMSELLIRSTLYLTDSFFRQRFPNIELDNILPLTTSGGQEDPCLGLALKIAWSLEYFVQPEMGLVGIEQIGAPLSVADAYFAWFDMREGAWLAVIKRKAREMGVELEGFLNDIANNEAVILQLFVP
ncbi:hypothetical protein DV736_g3267, partial [Chaetothyriales sp. CBS 134916]